MHIRPRLVLTFWLGARLTSKFFVDNAAAVGLDDSRAQKFKQAVLAATETEAAATAARLANKNATTDNSMKFADLRKVTGDTVRIIKTFAQTTGNDNVYTIAQVPPPQDPSTVPPPAKPTDLRVTLDPATGAPMITWKAANPRGSNGTSYIIRRRTSPTSQFEFVGVTGTKKFIDNGFFAGPDSVQYTVQGQRSDSSGPVSDILVVNFGRVNGGGFSVTDYATESAESSPAQLKRAA